MLSFDIFTPLVAVKMTVRAYLNGILITQLYIPSNCTFKTKVDTFYANKTLNTLCFNETHSPAPPFAYKSDYGGLIDNISLFLIQKQFVNFEYVINELDQSLILEGNSTYSDDLGSNIEKRYDLFVEGKPINYKVENSDSGSLVIKIKENYCFHLQNIEFVEKSGYTSAFKKLIVQVTLSPPTSAQKYYFYLR